MAILLPTDFSSGRYKIATNQYTETNLTDKITYVEDTYLPKLFGKELNDLFIADLSGSPSVPTTARFLTVFNPLDFQTNGCLFQSQGIKVMLQGFVYYHFESEAVARTTTVSPSIPKGENSDNVSAHGVDVIGKYNEAIVTLQTLQYYMQVEEDATYPEYEGVIVNFNHPY